MKLEPSMELSSVRPECDDFNLREWSLKAKTSRENNTNSRRFSASYIRSFREDANKSFRSNIIISSTASSPGYTLREEIDPSTYSFTTALKALQAKTGYSWDYMSPDGLSLNSKWNEAEKYICNPLSGEVPLECLSAKTLSARSFRQLTSKITMSAPLIYPSTQTQTRQFHTKPYLSTHETEIPIPSQEKKDSITRDVGTQSSTPAYLIPNTPSPILTPCIEERSINRCESDADDSSMATPKSKSEEQVEVVKGTTEKEDTETNEGQRKKVKQQMSSSNSRCRQGGGGCLAWKSLWMRRRQRDKHKSKKKNNLFCHINGC